MFVGFKSGSPTVFKSKRHRARCFLNGGKSSKLSALCLKLIYVTQRWPFSDSSAREFPSLHMLPQRGFREVVSRELVKDSTRLVLSGPVSFLLVPPSGYLVVSATVRLSYLLAWRVVADWLLSSLRFMATKASALCGALPSTPCGG